MSSPSPSTVTEKPLGGWDQAPSILPLPVDEVHVWQAMLGSDALSLESHLENYRAILSEDEIDRANRFHFERDRDRFAAARGILRRLVARYLDRDPSLLRLTYNENGKPALAGSDAGAVEFNLSHSHERVLYAFTTGRRVGVDIERIRADASDIKIAERFFSKKEVASLAALPEAECSRAFFRYWTAKEAYIKARGEGLPSGLPTTEVELGPDGEVVALRSEDAAGAWSGQTLDVGPEYAAALAIEGETALIRHYVYPTTRDNIKGKGAT